MLSKLSLQSYISTAALFKISKSLLSWEDTPWTYSHHGSPGLGIQSPLTPAPLQETSGEGWLLTPCNAQIPPTTRLWRNRIIGKANCFLDCFLSNCESFTLGAIRGENLTLQRLPWGINILRNQYSEAGEQDSHCFSPVFLLEQWEKTYFIP